MYMCRGSYRIFIQTLSAQSKSFELNDFSRKNQNKLLKKKQHILIKIKSFIHGSKQHTKSNMLSS